MFDPQENDDKALSAGARIALLLIGMFVTLYALGCLYYGASPSISRYRGYYLVKGNAVYLLSASYFMLAAAIYTPIFTWRNSKLGSRIALGFFLAFLILNILGDFYTEIFSR